MAALSIELSSLSASSMSTQSRSPVSLPSVAEPLLLAGSSSVHSFPSSGDPSPCTHSHGPHNGPKIAQGHHKERETIMTRGCRNAATISTLPDNVLLEIFDLFRENYDQFPLPLVWEWHLLVHICRRWRQITFASPRRLKLEILCKDGTPVRKNLGIWPAIPIVVRYGHFGSITPEDEDNTVAALEHPDRICHVNLGVTGSQLGKIATVMQKPFPVLGHLSISTRDANVPVIPSEFLGRSGPRLEGIDLTGVPFPALPTLLLSTSDLVTLNLHKIPPTGYISPEAMVARLAGLPRLQIFRIGFRLATPRPDRMHLPPVTRTVLPALTLFEFSGVCEYLEDFVARIDAPRLDRFTVAYSNQVVDFEVPHLSRFIVRTGNLKQTQTRRCELELHHPAVQCHIDGPGRGISVSVMCQGTDWQISHMTRVLGWISPTLFDVVHLIIDSRTSEPEPEVMDDIEWLQLLRPFSSVRMLLVSGHIAGHVSRALEDIAEVMVTEMLPALDSLCLLDQQREALSVDKFVAVRQDSGHPVTMVKTRRVFNKKSP